jgi:hypothetical protein
MSRAGDFINTFIEGKYQITNQKDLRKAFWDQYGGMPDISKVRSVQFGPGKKTYNVDTRVAFSEFIDSMAREGTISQELAHRATLD